SFEWPSTIAKIRVRSAERVCLRFEIAAAETRAVPLTRPALARGVRFRHHLIFMSAVPHPFRRTKIIFTLGPSTESEAMLEKLIVAGADIVRLNMAHAKHEWTREIIPLIRSIS